MNLQQAKNFLSLCHRIIIEDDENTEIFWCRTINLGYCAHGHFSDDTIEQVNIGDNRFYFNNAKELKDCFKTSQRLTLDYEHNMD